MLTNVRIIKYWVPRYPGTDGRNNPSGELS